MIGLENMDRALYEGVGLYDIPELKAVDEFTAKDFGRLIYWNKENNPKDTCLHTFSYDYQFNSVWSSPDKWLPRLHRFDSVLAPDFSMYTDMPKALQIYNHFRKHWVARYWSENGIKVIPNIGWSTPDSYEWCFDGEPVNSVVAVSSVGCLKKPEAKKLFLEGFEAMMDRLNPKQIILYGAVPDEIKKYDLIKIPHHYEAMKEKNK